MSGCGCYIHEQRLVTSDIERLHGGSVPVSSSRSRWSSSSHQSNSSSLSESSPIWDIGERTYSGSEGSVLALLAAITHCSST